jgi:hypothetical protein
MDLDDGVMVNSAALRALMRPLWKKPEEWWGILSKPAGKKDFDWSHLAMRYWPKRVMAKVVKDPSLAVAHSDYGAFAGRDLFEELHPEAAKKWREDEAARAGGGAGGGEGDSGMEIVTSGGPSLAQRGGGRGQRPAGARAAGLGSAVLGGSSTLPSGLREGLPAGLSTARERSGSDGGSAVPSGLPSVPVKRGRGRPRKNQGQAGEPGLWE